MSTLHIVFGWTAYGMLKSVLRERGSTDRVARIADDLSWGPIHGSLAARARYFEQDHIFQPGWWSWIPREHRNFREAIETTIDRRLVWLGSNHAPELAGYLYFLDRFPDIAAEIVRPDDYFAPHPKYGPPGSIGILNPEQVAEVLDKAPRTDVSKDAHLSSRWAELKGEGALLRKIDSGGLVSVSLDHFDRLLLGAASSEWTPHIRVVGMAIAAAFDERLTISSDLLFSRLGALVDAGKLEAQGDVRGWTKEGPREKAQVRLPA